MEALRQPIPKPLLAALFFAPLAASCADDDGPNCRHRVCDIRDASCVEFVAEVVACQRDVPVVQPNVRFMTSDELLAEREAPTAEQLEFERDYWAGEALVGLMPEGYDPANTAADSISGFLAFYRWREKEIVILSDADIDDDETAYRVLVHEMLHAQQDAEYDLAALWDAHATSFARGLGVRAAVEGEAVVFTAFSDIELAGYTEDQIDWAGYFADWKAENLREAQASEVPSLDVTALFPYAFGGDQVYQAWSEGGLDGVRAYVQDPPDSVRQVMAGFAERPPKAFNGDAQLEDRAVPVLPGHTYLDGGMQDSWLLNTMLQRTAGSVTPWASALGSIEADHLSVWRDDDTGAPVAVWRLVGDSMVIESALTGSDSDWVMNPDDTTTHHLRRVEGDWVLVAAQTETAAEIADSITGWQSRDEARESAGLRRDRTPREFVLHGHAP